MPSGQGLAATAKAFAGVMAGVWAGSQVTKAPRAAAALMLAPLVDRLMGALQGALGLRSRRQVSQVEPFRPLPAPAWVGRCTEVSFATHSTPPGACDRRSSSYSWLAAWHWHWRCLRESCWLGADGGGGTRAVPCHEQHMPRTSHCPAILSLTGALYEYCAHCPRDLERVQRPGHARQCRSGSPLGHRFWH